jgi:hypothetical protein
MDVVPNARWTSTSESTTAMTDLRRCIGSVRFGIEAHEAPPEDFPVQPSGRDGLGRMCKIHWNQYTAGLARDAKARKAADGADVATAPVKETAALGRRTAKEARAADLAPIRTRPPRKVRGTAATTAEVAQETNAG